MSNPFSRLYYDCLDSLINNNDDSDMNEIIKGFNERNNNCNNNMGEWSFGLIIYPIIDQFKGLYDNYPGNALLQSFVNKIPGFPKYYRGMRRVVFS